MQRPSSPSCSFLGVTTPWAIGHPGVVRYVPVDLRELSCIFFFYLISSASPFMLHLALKPVASLLLFHYGGKWPPSQARITPRFTG